MRFVRVTALIGVLLTHCESRPAELEPPRLRRWSGNGMEIDAPVGWTVRRSPHSVRSVEFDHTFGEFGFGERMRVTCFQTPLRPSASTDHGCGSHVESHSMTVREGHFELVIYTHTSTDGWPSGDDEHRRIERWQRDLARRIIASARAVGCAE